MYFDIKNEIKKAIISEHGSIKKFIERNPEKGFTQSKISLTLNPSNNTTLKNIYEIVECLEIGIKLYRKPNLKVKINK